MSSEVGQVKRNTLREQARILCDLLGEGLETTHKIVTPPPQPPAMEECNKEPASIIDDIERLLRLCDDRARHLNTMLCQIVDRAG